MSRNSSSLNGFIERSHSLEREGDLDAIESVEPVENGGKKEVYKG